MVDHVLHYSMVMLEAYPPLLDKRQTHTCNYLMIYRLRVLRVLRVLTVVSISIFLSLGYFPYTTYHMCIGAFVSSSSEF